MNPSGLIFCALMKSFPKSSNLRTTKSKSSIVLSRSNFASFNCLNSEASRYQTSREGTWGTVMGAPMVGQVEGLERRCLLKKGKKGESARKTVLTGSCLFTNQWTNTVLWQNSRKSVTWSAVPYAPKLLYVGVWGWEGQQPRKGRWPMIPHRAIIKDLIWCLRDLILGLRGLRCMIYSLRDLHWVCVMLELGSERLELESERLVMGIRDLI